MMTAHEGVSPPGMKTSQNSKRPASLVLTGFMGTGKTTVGRILAARGNLRWLDTDHLLEERYGRDVPTIFLQEGEVRLREYEAKLCRELAGQDGLLITTGGGTLLRPAIAAHFEERALVVCLTAREDTIACRVEVDDDMRPLFAGEWWKLLAERQPRYHEFPNQVATDGRHAHQVADEVWDLWVKARQPA